MTMSLRISLLNCLVHCKFPKTNQGKQVHAYRVSSGGGGGEGEKHPLPPPPPPQGERRGERCGGGGEGGRETWSLREAILFIGGSREERRI